MNAKRTDLSSDSGDSTGDVILTPAGTVSPNNRSDSPTSSSNHNQQQSASAKALRLFSLPQNIKKEFRPDIQQKRQNSIDFGPEDDEEEDGKEEEHGSDLELDDMSGRPVMHRPTGGQSYTPLLHEPDSLVNSERGRGDSPNPQGSRRPPFAARRSTFRSRSPSYEQPANLTRRKYIYAAFFLILSLIAFVVQTETAVYIQTKLHWDKAYCMLWLTHGSWSLLWPTQLLIIRIQKRKLSWRAFWRRHRYLVRSTAQMVQSQDLYLNPQTAGRSPWPYMIKTTTFITTFLTCAGLSWYVAVKMTSASDLTAIYNCSAFFAYVFSMLLLHDKFRFDKIFAVALAIGGVLVVAYGDQKDPKQPGHSGGSTKPTHPDDDSTPSNKLLGNLIIGIGSVLYGLYEVLYKKYACPPEGCSPGRGMIFANTFGSMIGLFTLTVLWIPLPILHYTGIETFEMPRGETALLLAISTLSNAVFSGSFLVLMSLTSPVLSSVAALLTIFLVALTDWVFKHEIPSGAAIGGSILIIVAFLLLSWATYREMNEEQIRRAQEDDKVFDDDDEGEAMLGGSGAGDFDDDGDDGDDVRRSVDDKLGRKVRKVSVS